LEKLENSWIEYENSPDEYSKEGKARPIEFTDDM